MIKTTLFTITALFGCGAVAADEVTVFAAASLQGALTQQLMILKPAVATV